MNHVMGLKKWIAAMAMLGLGISGISIGAQAAPSDVASETAMSAQQAAMVQETLSAVAKDLMELSDKDPDLKKGNVAKALDIVDKKVLPLLDKESMAKRAAGKFWRSATPEQRLKLADLVPKLMGKSYAKALFELKGATVSFSPAKVVDGQAKVGAKISPKGGQPIQLSFAAVIGADGKVQVQDIVIEGVSLIGAFASNFASVINQKGLEGLLVDLAAKVG